MARQGILTGTALGLKAGGVQREHCVPTGPGEQSGCCESEAAAEIHTTKFDDLVLLGGFVLAGSTT